MDYYWPVAKICPFQLRTSFSRNPRCNGHRAKIYREILGFNAYARIINQNNNFYDIIGRKQGGSILLKVFFIFFVVILTC